MQFLLDNAPLGAEDLTAPYSVSWNTTTSANGGHTLTAKARDAAGNTSTSAAVNVTVSNAPPTQSPYTGTPFAMPGRFEAEDFDKGGEGVAYHDNVPGNAGGLYRPTEDVDIVAAPYAGGYVVNNFETGEWMEYTINVTSAGTYTIEALVSSEYPAGTSKFHVSIDDVDKTGVISVPNTGLWSTFQWVGKSGISLTGGQHVLRLTSDVQYFNVDALRLTLDAPSADTTPPSVSITAPTNGMTVANTIPVTANASDNVGVVGVQFLLDNAPLGAEDTTAPYSVSWNTTTSTNGSHTLTAKARDAAGNSNTSAPVNVTVSNTPPVQQQTPFTGTPFVVPGRFEAEDFDKGGEGVAYHDNVPGNAGGLYRPTEDVDIVAAPYAGGYVVNNFETGEWMEYTINVTSAGTYTIEALVSSEYPAGTSKFHVSIDDVDKTGVISVPNTGLWSTFQWVGKSGISLTGGQHVLRLTSDVQYFNVDALRLTLDAPSADTTPPSVSITAPTNGMTVANTIPVTANASDNVGVVGVQFLLDNAPLGAEDTTAPYSVSWNTTTSTNGSHTLTAKARDAAGNTSTSAAVNVTVSNTPPVQQETPYYGTPFTIPGTFNAVDFDKGGEGVAYHDNTPGNQGGQYRLSEAVDIIPGPTAGTYVVNNFENGEWLQYTINVTASGTYKIELLNSSQYNNTAQFHISIDGVDKTGPVISPKTGNWQTFIWMVAKDGVSLTAGQHILRVTTDVAYFNFESIRVTQTSTAPAAPAPPPADTMPPTVSITGPMSGVNVSGTVQVTANASDNIGVVGVQFYVDGNTLGAEVTSAPWLVVWNTATGTNGFHALTAVARDAAGNTATSAPVQVTVANTSGNGTGPTVAISSPANGATISGTVQISATASSNTIGVRFYLNGVALGLEDNFAPFLIAWDTTTTTNGTYTLTANARDLSGNVTTSAPISVTVSNAARKRTSHR